jgi:hypothetical protein
MDGSLTIRVGFLGHLDRKKYHVSSLNKDTNPIEDRTSANAAMPKK